MTPSLSTQIAQLAEFDEDVPRQESYRLDETEAKTLGEQYLDNYSYIEGARFENARLKPLILALGECVSALEHPGLLEELSCTCGYYGSDEEETGMSECPQCAIKRTLQGLSEVLARLR